MKDSGYYSDEAVRERCLLMAIDAHKRMDLENKTVRETAHNFFNFIKAGLVYEGVCDES